MEGLYAQLTCDIMGLLHSLAEFTDFYFYFLIAFSKVIVLWYVILRERLDVIIKLASMPNHSVCIYIYVKWCMRVRVCVHPQKVFSDSNEIWYDVGRG